VLAQFDPAQFTSGAAGFITQDEESSGIIDAARFLGGGSFLFDAQVHKAIPRPTRSGTGNCWRCACRTGRRCSTNSRR
jgi:hypothetical protein